MELPDHIVQKSPKWYLNTKSGKWIHSDFIETWANNYWRNRKGTKKVAINYKKNIKQAFRRWNDE